MKLTHNIFLSSLLSCVFALSIGGCSKQDSSADEPTSSMSYDVFIAKLAKVTCDSTAPCCAAPTTVAPSCDEKLASLLPVSQQFSLLDHGMRFDADHAQACLDAVKKRADSCNHLFDDENVAAACRKVLVPTLSAGESCEVDEQCAADAHGSARCVPGPDVCVVSHHLDIGQKCGSAMVSTKSIKTIDDPRWGKIEVESAVCDPAKAFCEASSGLCTHLREVGEACDVSSSCRGGGATTSCVAHENGSSTCEALPTLGQICSFDCAGKATCGYVDGQSVCVAQKPGAASCFSNDECESGVCFADGVCMGLPSGTSEFLASAVCE